MKAIKLAWGGIKFAAKWVGSLGLVSSGIGLVTSFVFPGWGTLAQMVLGSIVTAAKWIWSQFAKACAECLANPRVFIVIGIAFLIGRCFGIGIGYDQGKGDLDTYRQEAIVYQQQADATADAAKQAKAAAEAAERAKIAAEEAKAAADQKAASTAAELDAAKAAATKAAADKAIRQRSSRTGRATSKAKSSSNDLLPWISDLFRT
jgi:hypothetical protein